MTREDVVRRMQEIFRDIFNDSSLIVSEHLNTGDIDYWDSLNHINLLSAIQQEFHVTFELNELHDLNNVGAIVDSILKKSRQSQ
ncbi:acyl carrier protein [Legionella oakridgensis]|uniref:Acyl carrier protein n=2 Tax=Legionella oakridgensis TaxID=29423 RepID=W0BC83_9GAMM|nr:acyl carrier protein [Legionella oakridgensis]AHE68148.1 acyl carrier protein [Legionella oakridgensis ATCC 33761 = DSM 21215]ETO92362.1 acyl carrier protein [Legionella oakridgensis RV-2-2007]KTD37277.1 Acyl carrier protein [Legionella oakridgensis]STY21117.1 Uncharacterised protein [Legionella longbeachae]